MLWDYFEPPKGEKAKCNLCKKEVSCVGGTTSGLKKHLKAHLSVLEEYLKKHEEREKEVKGAKRVAEDQAETKPLKQMKLDFGASEVTKAKQVDFDDALVNFVAETGVSFNVIGHQSFRDLIEVANRQIIVKSSQTVSRKVKATADSVLSDVSDILAAVRSTIPSIGFTTDMWTSRCQVIAIFNF